MATPVFVQKATLDGVTASEVVGGMQITKPPETVGLGQPLPTEAAAETTPPV